MIYFLYDSRSCKTIVKPTKHVDEKSGKNDKDEERGD